MVAPNDQIASVCTVSRHDDFVCLEFDNGLRYEIPLSIIRRSEVLAELEQAHGERANLSERQVRNWLRFVKRGQFHLDVEQLASALKV
jgi:hypothetical protein